MLIRRDRYILFLFLVLFALSHFIVFSLYTLRNIMIDCLYLCTKISESIKIMNIYNHLW